MIRPFTCVCMLLAGGAGLYLYQTKHRALLLDREIAHTVKQTDAARERITGLRAEWALLNEPERLAELQAQHLGLRPLAPTQFVALADLAARLPAPLPAGSVILPELTDEIVADRPLPEKSGPEPVRTATLVRPAPITPVVPVPAAAVPPPPALRPLRTARRDETPDKPAAPKPAVAAVVQAPLPAPAPIQLATMRQTTVQQATLQQATVQQARAPIVLAPRPAPSYASAPSPLAPGMVGQSVQRMSALGSAQAATALPPPIPYNGN